MIEKLRGNQFPFRTFDINTIKQISGVAFGDEVVQMTTYYSQNGGCNPNAIAATYRDAPGGEIDIKELQVIVNNFNEWHDIN